MPVDNEQLAQSFLFYGLGIEEGKFNYKELKYLNFKMEQIKKYMAVPSFERYLQHKATLKKHVLLKENETLCNKSGNTITIEELLIINPEELKDICKICLKKFRKTQWQRDFTIW